MMKYQDDPEKAFNSMKKITKQYMNVLMIPSNPQTVQVSSEYGFQVLVGGQGYIDIDIYKNNNVAAVYDMSNILIEELEHNENLVINLVIDEAHELTCSQYRGKAIRNLEKLKDLVLKQGGTVVYLTASYSGMCYLRNLKHILFCNKKVENVDFDELHLLLNKSNSSIEDITLNYLKDKKALVRLNRKDNQRDISVELSNMGQKSYYINSDEKKSIINKQTNERNYKNKMLDCIINEEVLPSDLKVGFCTSMIDAGSNIVGLGSKQNQPVDFETVHVIYDMNDLSLMNIEQFSNRIRFFHNKHTLIMNYKENNDIDKHFLTLPQIFKNCKKFLDTQVEYFKGEIELLRNTTYKNVENIEECIEKDINEKLTAKNFFDGLTNSVGGY